MIREKLQNDIKDAMRAKDEAALSALRMILAGIKHNDIEARAKGQPDGLKDEEILSLMQTMIKQRRESMNMYEQGNRPELVQKEAAEIKVIEGFMPKQMNDDEIAAAINALKTEIGAKDIKDMGRLMNELKTRFVGKMDFGKASPLVKAALS